MRQLQGWRWTLVQHSGYGYGHKPEFCRAVEKCAVTTASDIKKVQNAGGILFTSSSEASEAEYQTNYPPGVEGLIPRCRGQFAAKATLDGLSIYIPAPGELEPVKIKVNDGKTGSD